MPTSVPARSLRKKPDTYHHGDLPRAMVQDAVRTIQKQGIAGLTLRGVGERLGVSRSALYRHFADKQALLWAVAGEGFRMLRADLFGAWDRGGRGRAGFDAMGMAYVRFAVTHPAHYRVMFGGFVTPGDKPEAVRAPEADAFQVLVDAIVEQQGQGLIRSDEPRQLALYIWAIVHGVSMIALDGMLPRAVTADMLMTVANQRMHTGIASSLT